MGNCTEPIEVSPINGYKLLFKAATMIPLSHYLLGFLCVSIVLFYNVLEFHFIEDFFSGGSPVKLTYDSGSELYEAVVSKCRILHGRYFSTPWLASPHLQTTLLDFLGRPPSFSYRREIFRSSDGGTFALDWLLSSDVLGSSVDKNNVISKNDSTPIVVVVPGLTSDSSAAYIEFLSYHTAKRGWNVVVCNHRGQGGISFTSDRFYNAGWTTDIRDVVNYLHDDYPKAPLFVIGTSLGANIVARYLGEDGENCPAAGAAVICSPWDLLISSRFIGRNLVQRVYDKVLTIGLISFARLNQAQYSKHGDWEGILKARSVRDFDRYGTCMVDKIETVDTYYRWSSSAPYMKGVRVPLLCISSLDDPVCAPEAIAWDECRANKNVVLATTKHGGHLGYFEGITASSLWWVRAVNEFLGVLHSTPLVHKQKKTQTKLHCSLQESLIDQGPYVSVTNGMVAAVDAVEEPMEGKGNQNGRTHEMILDTEQLKLANKN